MKLAERSHSRYYVLPFLFISTLLVVFLLWPTSLHDSRNADQNNMLSQLCPGVVTTNTKITGCTSRFVGSREIGGGYRYARYSLRYSWPSIDLNIRSNTGTDFFYFDIKNAVIGSLAIAILTTSASYVFLKSKRSI